MMMMMIAPVGPTTSKADVNTAAVGGVILVNRGVRVQDYPLHWNRATEQHKTVPLRMQEPDCTCT
jgi:hypothetical protein